MSDVGFVVAGWSITGAVLLGYWLWIAHRTRRAMRVRSVERVTRDG